ncbi:hypothetical protein AA310_00030 [Arthrobacter sp. YC-RL1]|nr:hypothetical protein ATC04_18320 [Arthrobacter sp. YC-RL1]ALQ32656.1 hypothetical protein ATC04_18560 [Arthrobacter sp. YC-RL1]KLI90693.1 hypothetical protein AA310_00030 [Arthrobacter sp. YC-RL1]
MPAMRLPTDSVLPDGFKNVHVATALSASYGHGGRPNRRGCKPPGAQRQAAAPALDSLHLFRCQALTPLVPTLAEQTDAPTTVPHALTLKEPPRMRPHRLLASLNPLPRNPTLYDSSAKSWAEY